MTFVNYEVDLKGLDAKPGGLGTGEERKDLGQITSLPERGG
jgi:hypothetical protein